LRTDAEGKPAIPPSHDAPKHRSPREVTEEDGWVGLLNRFGEGADKRKVIKLAVELCLLLGPEFLHGPDSLPRLPPGVGSVPPHDCRLFLVPTCTDTKQKPATGVVVQGRDLLGEQQRVVLWDQTNPCAELERPGYSRGPREGHKGVHEL